MTATATTITCPCHLTHILPAETAAPDVTARCEGCGVLLWALANRPGGAA